MALYLAHDSIFYDLWFWNSPLKVAYPLGYISLLQEELRLGGKREKREDIVLKLRQIGVTVQTNYRWRKEYGDMSRDTFQFDRRLGLCLDCNKVVALEDLPDCETMERARAIREKYAGKPLLRLLEPDYAKYLASQDDFDILEQVIALKRKAVCLQCGKSAVRSIVRPEGVNSDTPVSLDLGHPWCTGTLQAQDSGGLRIGIRPETRIYSIHGQLISTFL
ncbi:hypothetical protein N9E48_01710 [Paracoccaceae bacterium]|nr:hypothetical protein [Paracoccaceae bacterium]